MSAEDIRDNSHEKAAEPMIEVDKLTKRFGMNLKTHSKIHSQTLHPNNGHINN